MEHVQPFSFQKQAISSNAEMVMEEARTDNPVLPSSNKPWTPGESQLIK